MTYQARTIEFISTVFRTAKYTEITIWPKGKMQNFSDVVHVSLACVAHELNRGLVCLKRRLMFSMKPFFCRGQLRNVPRCIKHAQRHCTSHALLIKECFNFATFSLLCGLLNSAVFPKLLKLKPNFVLHKIEPLVSSSPDVFLNFLVFITLRI